MKLTRSLLLTLTFLFTVSAANGDQKYDHGVIIEYEDWAQYDNQNLISAVKSALTNTSAVDQAVVTTRIEYSSSVFRGISANISGIGSHVTPGQIRATLQDLPMVKKVTSNEVLHSPSRKSRRSNASNLKSLGTQGINKRDDGSAFVPSALSSHVMTGVDKLHANGTKGKNIRIAVLDQGFDYKQAAFGNAIGPGNKIVYGYDWVGDDYTASDPQTGEAGPIVEDTDPYSDCTSHGTLVLGIVAANPTKFGVVGTAPEASYELHRIAGCHGGVDLDIFIKAVIGAYERRVDIITTSMGFPFSYPDNPLAAIATRINRNGTFFQVAAGNSGIVLYGGQIPAAGIDVTAVGAVRNTETPFYTWGGTYTTHGKQLPFRVDVTDTMDFPQTFKIWTASAKDSDAISSACKPFPADLPLPDFSTTVALIPVPDTDLCEVQDQLDNILAAGFRYALLYPLFPLTGEIGQPDFSGIAAFGSITTLPFESGSALFAAYQQDKSLIASIETAYNHEDMTTYLPNNVTGGRMALLSSWGPTADGRTFPTFSAPGVSILTTAPRNLGGFKVTDGTSISAPFTAGVAALLKSHHPEWPALTIRNVLATTANPMPHADNTTKNYGFLAPVFQQGGGLVDAFRAVHTNTIVNTPGLSFNDSAHSPFQPKSISFKVRNIGTSVQVFKAHHIPAISGYGISSDDPYAAAGRDALVASFSRSYANLSISPASFTLVPNTSVNITVTLNSLPASLDPKRLPFYGGYISLNCTADATQTVTVPYTGIATNLKNLGIVVQTRMQGYTPGVDDANLYGDAPAGQPPVYNVTYQGAGKPWGAGTYPVVEYALASAAFVHTIEISLLKANGDFFLVFETRYEDDYTTYDLLTRLYEYDTSGTFIPAGQYRWRVRALKIYGNEKIATDWVESITDIFVLTYTKQSVGLPGKVRHEKPNHKKP